MEKRFDIFIVEGPLYHAQCTMGRGQYPMDRGFYIPYVEGSNYYGYGVQNTMDKGSKNDWLEVKMPCVGGSKYY
jgi:hypothetical protein